ncbi:MAG: hypothetical protein NTV61_09775 [Candidatus Bathyarchaeota archaeon]|nr:hypothetical protein [Candidatus Bathyarchaeota archaeon]
MVASRISMRLVFKVLIGVFVVLVGVFGYMSWAMTAENPSPVTAINPQSSGPKALVVSDPGISGFESGVAEAFATGLASHGWHVDVTTASAQTPTDLNGYSLLVLSSPIYAGEPSKPLQSYMTRLGSLGGVRVATVLTGAGATPVADAWMTSKIGSMGGDEVLSLIVFSMAPNAEQYGSTDPQGIAAGAAASLTP